MIALEIERYDYDTRLQIWGMHTLLITFIVGYIIPEYNVLPQVQYRSKSCCYPLSIRTSVRHASFSEGSYPRHRVLREFVSPQK